MSATIPKKHIPAATGALATGRLGTAVLAVLLPLIARAGVAAHGLRHGSESGGGARGSYSGRTSGSASASFSASAAVLCCPCEP